VKIAKVIFAVLASVAALVACLSLFATTNVWNENEMGPAAGTAATILFFIPAIMLTFLFASLARAAHRRGRQQSS